MNERERQDIADRTATAILRKLGDGTMTMLVYLFAFVIFVASLAALFSVPIASIVSLIMWPEILLHMWAAVVGSVYLLREAIGAYPWLSLILLATYITWHFARKIRRQPSRDQV